MIYVVSYDLSQSESEKYSDVEVALASCGVVNHFQRSVCLLSSEKTAVEIRDTVKPYLDKCDTLFVGGLNHNWAGWRTKLQAWIQEQRADS